MLFTHNVILTIGLPGCGKSTWAINNTNGFHIIERDIIRREICEEMGISFSWNTWDMSLEDRVTQLWNDRSEKIIAEGGNICFSDTNLNRKYRKKLIERMLHAEYDVTCVLFDIDVDICKKRNVLRGNMAVKEIAYERLLPYFHDCRKNIEHECKMYGINFVCLNEQSLLVWHMPTKNDVISLRM